MGDLAKALAGGALGAETRDEFGRNCSWTARWPLVMERSDVQRPMSLGLRLETAEGAEAEVVLYAGGWADVLVAAPPCYEIEPEYVELEAVDEFDELLDRIVARVTAR